MSGIKVQFSLECWKRKDEEANVLVGYIPALRLYSQGRNDEELKGALTSAAEMWIVVAYEKDILGKGLRDRGMTRASGLHATSKSAEFISITTEVESRFERAFDVQVPIDLLIAQQLTGASTTCPQ